MTSTGFIRGLIQPGMVIPYQTGWAYTVQEIGGETYHIRNVTYSAAALAKAAMRECVVQHNENKQGRI